MARPRSRKKSLLIRTITTREELDEFEQQCVEKAIGWAMRRKFRLQQILTEDFVKDLHKGMFGGIWKWTVRASDIGREYGMSQITVVT